MRTKVTYEEFLSRLDENFPYEFITPYINFTSNIIVKDKYGELETKPYYLIKNRPLSVSSAVDKTLYTINRFKEIHGDKYDYSKFEFISARTSGTIICPIHGEFKQLPNNHFRQGCHKCGVINNGFARKDFIERSKGKICSLYIIKCWNEEESFIKIGITAQTIKKRFVRERDMPYNYELIDVLESTDAAYIYEQEKNLKRKFKNNRYTPIIKFAGKTECYIISTMETLLEYTTTEKRK